ncbi:Ig-like domain-containing protein [Caulobacter sp. 73W]|uniref:Ig-like domain-containing protein n=1 Tax=Caulobacter sp. 73W TaxID=3161137 RepID=A0AB39KYV7_9CAUL
MTITFTVGDDNHLAGPERQEPITIRGEGATPGSTLQVTFGSGPSAVTIEIEVSQDPEWGGFFEGYIDPQTHAVIYEMFEAAVAVSVFDGTQSASILVTVPGEGAVLSEPTISTSTGVDLVRAGQTIIFEVQSDKEVAVFGAPHLDLGDGRKALFDAEASTTTTLRFVYTVQAADHGEDLSVLGLNLGMGGIRTDDGAAATASWNTVSVGVEIDTLAPGTPSVDLMAGDNRINLEEAQDGVTIEGLAEPQATVQITLGGQTRSVTADADGAYSLTLSPQDISSLAQGGQFVTFKAVDAAGNVGQAATRSILVDTIAPSAPVVDTIAQDGVINAQEAEALVVEGSAEAGSSVFMRLGATTFQAVVSDGAFSFPISANDVAGMGEGAETLTFWAVDEAGNVGQSVSRTIAIDTLGPSKPTVLAIAGDDVIDEDETGVVVTGTTEAGSAVTLTFSGVTRTAQVSGSSWSYALTAADLAAMGEGPETISVVARDAAGNTSQAADRTFTVAAAAQAVAPSLVSAVIDGAKLTLGYDRDLDVASQLDAEAFTVDIAGGHATVASVGFDGARKIVLTLSQAARSAQTVSLAYADPDPTADDDDVVQSTDGADAASFTGQSVRNLTAAPPPPPPPPADDPADPAPPPPQPGQQPGIVDLGGVAIGADLESDKALAESVTLPDGRVVANPLHATALAAKAIAAKVEAGLMTKAQAHEALIELSMPTTGVAHDAYRFFTGSAPSAEGLAWLINSAANPNDLTDPYYAMFSAENRYINFAVNLGVHGDGATAFAAAYGHLSFEAAVAKAYETIIGKDEARAASIDLELAFDYIEGQQAYFQALGGGDLGAKAAMIGYIISAGAKAQVGQYYEAAHDFIERQIELAGVAYPAEGA